MRAWKRMMLGLHVGENRSQGERRKLVMYNNGIELLEFARVKTRNSNFVNVLNFTLHSLIENR